MNLEVNAFVKDAMGCALLNNYPKYLRCFCNLGEAEVKQKTLAVADRMLNDGTISQKGYNCVKTKLEEGCGDEAAPAHFMMKKAVKCFIQHIGAARLAEGDIRDPELAKDFKDLLDIKANCKASTDSFVTKYDLAPIAENMLNTYFFANDNKEEAATISAEALKFFFEESDL